MMWPAADAIKQQIPLLDYLQTQDWKPARRISRGRLMGLCPLHLDRQPSFLVDPAKNLWVPVDAFVCRRGTRIPGGPAAAELRAELERRAAGNGV